MCSAKPDLTSGSFNGLNLKEMGKTKNTPKVSQSQGEKTRAPRRGLLSKGRNHLFQWLT